jgi:hypothetical protein
VHDIGKLSVPNSILKKPDRLLDREFDVIKRHPEIGFRMLLDLGFSAGVAQVVLDHHERLDGSGYPRGLAGPAMSLEARILAVCDVYRRARLEPCLPPGVLARGRDGHPARGGRHEARPPVRPRARQPAGRGARPGLGRRLER